jgi:hypothetical protein
MLVYNITEIYEWSLMRMDSSYLSHVHSEVLCRDLDLALSSAMISQEELKKRKLAN